MATVNPAGTTAVAEPQAGDVLGAYRLEALAGEGGMGRVFRAVHVKLGRTVALKLLRRKYARPGAIARFFAEARAVNVIRHPNIIEIHDFFEAPPGGDSYYIMEWLDGTTLDRLIERHGTLPPKVVRERGQQLASALAAAHDAGFVHRDVKPENVLVVEQEGEPTQIKLLDFGVTQLLGGDVAGASGGGEPSVAGTPAYLSPEVAEGRTVDGRSDIYSLGCVLYELLVGHPPLQAATFSEYVLKHMTVRPVPVEEAVASPVPSDLARAIDRCLEKRPEARFQTMRELADALSSSESSTELAGRSPRRSWPYALGASVVVGLALIVAVISVADPRTGAATPPSRKPALPSPPKAEPAAPPGVVEDRLPVVVTSLPPGAEVLEEGVVLGRTPCTLQLRRASHTVELRLDGHRPVLRTLDPATDSTVEVHLEKKLLKARATTTTTAPTKRDATINPFAP